MASEIILYDLGSKYPKGWSANPWKTRLALNFKGLPYKTEFLQFPDIGPTLSAKGLPPNENAGGKYTVPTVRLPDGTYVMDSAKIVHSLEALKPLPTLHLEDTETLKRVEAVVGGCGKSFMADMFTRLRSERLEGAARDYITNMAQRMITGTIEEFEKETGGENAWNNAQPHLNELAQLLNENKNGPFVNGTEPSYSDLYILALFMSFRALDEKVMFTRLLAYDKSFQDLYNAGKPWTLKDD